MMPSRCDPTPPTPRALPASACASPNTDDHVILPEIISKEPLGPAVRHGDDQWFDIVKWTHFAMVNAEELGITKANVDDMAKSDNPDVKRLLGSEGKYGEALGLTNDWAVRIIKQVGNYGEVFEKNVGQGSQLKIARGLNALWRQGRTAIRAAGAVSRRLPQGETEAHDHHRTPAPSPRQSRR